MRMSDWSSDVCSSDLVDCVGGHTQIERVLNHTLAETRDCRVNALVYVGDCLEEDPDNIAVRAGDLGLQGVPIFAFRSEEHTSELQSLMRISYAVFCLKKKKQHYPIH